MDGFVFEASTNGKLATSCQLAALSFWLLAFGLKPMQPEHFSAFGTVTITFA
jgi:hypothetical protein